VLWRKVSCVAVVLFWSGKLADGMGDEEEKEIWEKRGAFYTWTSWATKVFYDYEYLLT
jgi:hypothetical protein